MAAKEAITVTINRINNSIKNKVPIIVELKLNSIEGLIKMLESENIIVIVKRYTNSCLIKVTTGITTLEVLPHFIHVKKKQLAGWRKRLLPNEGGHLIISTSKGMMSHRKAEQKDLGGQIIGFIH